MHLFYIFLWIPHFSEAPCVLHLITCLSPFPSFCVLAKNGPGFMPCMHNSYKYSHLLPHSSMIILHFHP